MSLHEREPETMHGGRFARPVRVGGEIHRRPLSVNKDSHRLLIHLERKGFELAPRFLGLTDDGAERLSYVPGNIGYPPLSATIRSDEALVSVARSIHAFHEASQDFQFSATSGWGGYEIARPATIDCVGHYDLAPWNIVFDGTNVKAIIDWDSAAPSNRVWDLAYAAHQFVPLHSEDDVGAWGWDTVPDYRQRLRLFLDSYGHNISPTSILDAAVMRLYGIGSYLAARIREQDAAFRVQADESHDEAYKAAALWIHENRERFL
jgi:Phosphotransferase enzyme family